MARRVVILVRHGEPVRGAGDEARLTPIGEQQVHLLGERLAGLGIDRVAHSPLPRAVHTAELLAAHLPDVPVSVDTSLVECLPSIPSSEHLLPVEREWFSGMQSDAAEGARIAATAARTWLAPPSLDDVEETVLAVSHGNLIRWLVAQAIGAPDTWFRMLDYHCGVWTIVLRPERRPQLVGANDVGHLPADLRGREYPAELRV